MVDGSHDCPITSRVEALHGRVDSLESSMEKLSTAITDISLTLASMQKEFEHVNKNLSTLATLHEKQLDLQREQSNITTSVDLRIGELKDAITRAHTRIDHLEGLTERVIKLEEGRKEADGVRANITWAVRIVVGAAIVATLALVGLSK